jgi:hypothetical protein
MLGTRFSVDSSRVPRLESALPTALRGRSPAYRAGAVDSPALQALVPGDERQTEEDLAAFPQPVLDMLANYGTRVAVLRQGQSLADTPGLRTLTPEEAQAEAKITNSLVTSELTAAFANGVSSYEQLETVADQVTRKLRGQAIDSSLGIALGPFQPADLAAARAIPADKVEDWTAAFRTLNSGLTQETPDGVAASYGIVVVPHSYHNGQAVPEIRLRNAGQVTSEFVEGLLGVNRPEERMVLLHEKFLSPSSELGNYRLAIHEVGHALDHALEHLTNFPGFGALHRQTVDALFEADKAKVVSGVPESDVFTSDRADDDVREYFAEAIEAYLTPEKASGDTFRAGNSLQSLAAKNPALFDYVEKVLTTEFPATAKPQLPGRTFAPPGFPDPDLEVLRIS